jgi:HAD superfamily hydrolase (TIGR01509 family)
MSAGTSRRARTGLPPSRPATASGGAGSANAGGVPAASSGQRPGGGQQPLHDGPDKPVLHLERTDAVLFDLDGVLTDTAGLHQAAWTAVFTELFAQASTVSGQQPAPFTGEDYRQLAHGEPRLDAVRNVLASRHVTLPEGRRGDEPGLGSMQAVAAAKDARFAALLAGARPRPFPGSVRLLQRLRAAGVLTAVVSASRHCAAVLAAAGLGALTDVVVDGQAAAAMGLAGKPDPATYLEAAARLGADPARAVVIDDALAGVTAGRRGGFGLVVGVARHGGTAELAAAGAHVVAGDLSDLRLAGPGPLADGWHLTYRPVGAAGEGMRETLCTLGNGYLATRGAPTWVTADGDHYPGTYLAGVYNRLETDVGGRRVEHESIVNAPNWLPLSFSAGGGPWLGEPGTQVSGEELRLDLRAGVLRRRFRVTDPEGRRTLVTERRLVSMAGPHLAAVELQLVAENWAGQLRVRSGIDRTCCTAQTAESRLLSHCHLVLAGAGEDPPGLVWLAARTGQSGIVIAEAARTTVLAGPSRPTATGGLSGAAEPQPPGSTREAAGECEPPGRGCSAGTREVSLEYVTGLAEGARCRVEKVAAIYTSKDTAISEPAEAARQAAAEAPGFSELLAAHRAVWAWLWERAALRAESADRPAGVVNLHLFHLLQVASPDAARADAGLAARGLHGEGYEGHVFWDELFVFPVLNLRFPEVSRALLAYRHRRLPAARRLAREAGEAGARFPWQSGSDGRDETPVMLFNPRSGRWMPDRSAAQRHVGLAVAWNCWQYWEATGDQDFLYGPGGEVITEVARHFAGLATFDEELGRYRIRGVMGPDEFHDGYPWTADPGVDDNAYTNVLAAWVLARAAELARTLATQRRDDVIGQLGISDDEIARFEQIRRRLYVPFHEGVISQFAGYQRLEPIDLGAYRARYHNIGRLDLILEAEGDTVRRYQVAKQADTLMLFYLFSPAELRQIFTRLGYPLTRETVQRTIAYYTARVTHGSTLSSVVHAWVAARADRASSWAHFTEALAADMADTQGGTTAEGIHLGAMAGTVDLLARCYPGLETRNGTLILAPALPDELASLAFTIRFRGHRLAVRTDHRQISVTSAPGDAPPAALLLDGQAVTLRPGQRACHRLAEGPNRTGRSAAGRPQRPQKDSHQPRRRPTKGEPAAYVADPVCGMVIEPRTAAATTTRDGTIYYFCSRACQARFEAGPRAYAAQSS